ncbi:MAG: hypothetical protein QM231_00285, partial [Chloroflexota bacterium]|nr:hypothetical protein [Chloroflexota bacterium]
IKALNNPSFKFLLFLQNSLYYAITATIGTVISCAMVAYAFARLRWWGRDVWFVLTLYLRCWILSKGRNRIHPHLPDRCYSIILPF